MMSHRTIFFPAIAAFAVAACGQSANGQSESAANATDNDLAPQAAAAASGQYTTDVKHRYITFSYDHKGYSRPWVRWRNWEATLHWDAENPENSSVSVVIDATSADSGVDVFDGHLRGEYFFDVENYPQITFVSTSVVPTGDTTGTITGDLTIKDVTKPVTLDATFNKAAFEERDNKYKLGFSASTTVKRSEFGLDYLVPVVGDDVSIVIEAELEMSAGDSE